MVKKYVYDIETLKNFFCLCCVDEEGNWEDFVIAHDRNDFSRLMSWLNDNLKSEFVGYNNLAFDSQVIEWMRLNRHEFVGLNPAEIAGRIHEEAQVIILEPMQRYWNTELAHRNVDLFKIMHFDNMARATSLKALEVAMRWPNVQDMPYEHDQDVTEEQGAEILAYCHNDVLATKEFMGRIQTEMKLRADLSQTYGIDFTNSSDSTLGERLMGHMMCELSGQPYPELKKSPGTHREEIVVNDILLPYINFRTPELRSLCSEFRATRITDTKGAFKHIRKIGNIEAHYGTGGIHGCIEPGVYDATDDWVIRDIDVASFYPNLSIQNDWRPEHLGNTFATVYRNIYEQRKQFPKKDPRNTAFKLMLNSVYGKSNSRFSWLYDPQFTMQITINGQLLISMLGERLATFATLLQINTDGLTIAYHPEHDSRVDKIMADWQKITKLVLEDVRYSKMVIRDVNNYMAVPVEGSGSIKYKGSAFVMKPEWHKDHSSLVIQHAVSAYFLEGTDPEDTVRNHTDPWDFLIRFKFKSNSKGFQRDEQGEEVTLSKTVRLYVSTDGMPLVKRMNRVDRSMDMTLVGNNNVTVVNEFDGSFPDNLDYGFYVKAAWDIINGVLPNETRDGSQGEWDFS